MLFSNRATSFLYLNGSEDGECAHVKAEAMEEEEEEEEKD